MPLSEVEEAIRAALVERARTGNREAAILSYRELGLDWDPDHVQQGTSPGSRPPFRGLPRALGNILRAEHEAGRPLLTSLVVTEQTGRPGQRFATLARELGVIIPEDEEAWWSAEVDRTVSYWATETREKRKGRLTDLTVEAVNAAMDEFDVIGRQTFLEKYGYGEARGLFAIRDGKQYDSKAIAGAAMGYVPDRDAWTHSDFSGGLDRVVPVLERLGFEVIDTRPKRNPRWSIEEIILALDVYLEHGILDDVDPRIEQLSDNLNNLHVHEQRPDAERWRNRNGAALKLANLAHFDPGYPGKGMDGGSRLDRLMFERLSPYPDVVARLADEVRAGKRLALDTLPVGNDAGDATQSKPAPSSAVTSTFGPVEQHHTGGKFLVQPTAEQREAERIEQPLVLRFCAFLDEGGYRHGRRTYRLDGVDYPCDLVVPEVNLLIEAKAKLTRAYLRMAVGQVKDYDFMHAEENGTGFDGLGILLRARPPASGVRYLAREGVGAIWAVSGGWAATSDIAERLPKCDWLA